MVAELDIEGPPFSERNTVAKHRFALNRFRRHPFNRVLFHVPAVCVVTSLLRGHLIYLPELKPSEFLENASVSFCLEDFKSGGMLEGTSGGLKNRGFNSLKFVVEITNGY